MAQYEPDGKTFTLISPGDYLEKIRWEFQRLTAMAPVDLPGFLYQTVTCLSDIWHMCDWVYAATSDPDHAGRGGLRRFRDEVKKSCRSLAIAREIADAHKHSRIDSAPDYEISTGYILGPGPLRKAPTTWYIVDGAEWLDPRVVVEDGIMFWIRHLGDHGLLGQTPLESIYRGEASLL